MKIVDLEACTMPSTPPEEREKREKTTMTTVESIKSLEEECAKLYEESTQVWTQLTEDAELQGIEKKLQVALEKVQKFKETMSTLPPTENMVAIMENRKLYLDINQMRAEQQAHTQNIETLQEEAFLVTEELAVAQGIVKQAVQESAEKLKTHITVETTEGILQ
jgi:hypothetical protein